MIAVIIAEIIKAGVMISSSGTFTGSETLNHLTCANALTLIPIIKKIQSWQ